MKFINPANKCLNANNFISRINDWLSGFNPENSIELGFYDIYEQLKLHAQLSRA